MLYSRISVIMVTYSEISVIDDISHYVYVLGVSFMNASHTIIILWFLQFVLLVLMRSKNACRC